MQTCVLRNQSKRNAMIRKLLFTLLAVSVLATAAWAQSRTVQGRVSSPEGDALPGVNVLVQGTAKGTTSDADGRYSLELEASENTLVFSFIGFKAQTVELGDRTTVDVTLEEDLTSLDEVVVVGYGVQREKDLTSAIATVKSEEINRTIASSAMQSLQGKVPGVQVVSAGSPGDGPTIRVRGVGSYPRTADDGDINKKNKNLNNEGPLYVVDGMFFDNIDFLNPQDIESISVLKDASSSAIYGVRAANGVVLIQTKNGSFEQPAQISYDGYFGYQIAQNVLKMANAEQFTRMALESGSPTDIANVNAAMQRYGRSRVNPEVPNVNTDWYDEILRPASIQNHSLSVSGGSSNTTYSIGGNYFKQDGILDMKNDYQRLNLRVRVDHKANDWLTVGGNLLLSNSTQYLHEEAVWNQAYFAVPILPVYDELNTAATPVRYASAQYIGYRSGQNPRPTMQFNENRFKLQRNNANFYVKIDMLNDKLSFQSSYNYSSSFLNQRNVDLPYFVSEGWGTDISALSKRTENTLNHIWDNVLTYNQSFGNHHVTAMAGTSFRDESYQMLRARALGLVVLSEEGWYIDKGTGIDQANVTDDGRREYGISYFGRLAYNFNDRYLVYGTMRAEATSKFTDTWGYFPAVGAGWVVSEEPFMKSVNAINFLKLRVGWGKLGNDKVPADDGDFTVAVVDLAINDALLTGSKVNNTFSRLGWEVTTETNIGISARLLNERLSLETDYFIRDTEQAVIDVQPPLVNTAPVSRNGGVIRNSGFEFSLNWADQFSDDLRYNIGVNLGTLKNEIRELYGNQLYIDGGSAEFRQRTIIGDPLLAFYGLEVVGVYQNDEQVQADPIAVENGLVPGDLIFRDQNKDGSIDGGDRVVLGSYFPTFTWGVNLGASWKNFDLSVNLMGQSGNKILNRKRGEYIWTPDGNMDAELAKNRWHGEGTSNSYPSSAGLRRGWNQRMSSFFVEDGDFFRIQNVTIGYNIVGKKALGVNIPKSRISFTAERPLTVFSYNGFNPEIPNGVDTQTYPIPAVYTVGWSLKF